MLDQLDYVIERLKNRTKPYQTIADETGVSFSTLRYLAEGLTNNPRIRTVDTLVRYFKSHET